MYNTICQKQIYYTFMLFYFYRIALSQNQQMDLLNSSYPEEIINNKTDFLKYIFKRRIDTRAYEKEYVYDYELEHKGYIGGVFGKLSFKERNKGPDKEWEIKSNEDWTESTLLLDPTSHDDGQKLFVEGDGKNKQKNFIDSLAYSINKETSYPWRIEIDEISEYRYIENVFSEYHNQISNISLDFPIANMPVGIKTPLNDARRKYALADARLKADIESPSGNIKTNEEVIKETVEMASETGAKIKVYKKDQETKGKTKVYDSSQSKCTKSIYAKIDETLTDIKDSIKSAINFVKEKQDD